jgi:CHAT domain-containing protein
LRRFAGYRDLARELHGWLVAPVLQRTEAQHWLVVAADFIGSLPLAALDDGRETLLDRVQLTHLDALSVLPTASTIAPTSRAAAERARSWISFNSSGTPDQPLTLAPRESLILGQTFDQVRVFAGDQSTKARLLEVAASARQLHLAMHARPDDGSPFGTALQLGSELVGGRHILGTRLRARLVVISACGAPPADGQGDRSSSLHRAFLLAGADEVVAAPWQVSDLGAALLMKYLFRRLREGIPTARALRQAKQMLRERYPHPAFWAPFQLHAE